MSMDPNFSVSTRNKQEEMVSSNLSKFESKYENASGQLELTNGKESWYFRTG